MITATLKFKLLSLVLFTTLAVSAQEDKSLFIIETDEGPMLIQGKATPLDFDENECIEDISNHNIVVGENFTFIYILDEMDDMRGLLILDKEGKPIDYSKTSDIRNEYNEYGECCVWVFEYEGKLIFYDYIDEDGNNYDCFYDAQTDGEGLRIPRYYIFDPVKNTSETVLLDEPVKEILVEGKLIGI